MSELEKTISFFFVLALAIVFGLLWLFGVIDPAAWVDTLGQHHQPSCAEFPKAGCRP